jgi:putative transcriptional regulator
LALYVTRIKREMKVEHYFLAMATKPIKTGEKLGLAVKKGVLYAVASTNPDAEVFGTATTDAIRGEDMGLKDLQGKLKMRQGKILIVTLPSIKQAAPEPLT